MNKELLLDIFKIAAPSGKEEKMQEYIEKYLKKLNIPFIKDEVGNIYNIAYDNKPMLSAHIDTVQSAFDADLTKFVKIRDNVLSGYGVIGGDDKCGIYIILDVLKDRKINFFLSVGEEAGGKGSSHFAKLHKELKNVLYCLVLDRRGTGDLICKNNQYGTIELEEDLLKVGKEFGYKSAIGSFSDADFLNNCLSCANLSVGYYNPHSRTEFVRLTDLERANLYVKSIIDTLTWKYDKPDNYYGKNKWKYGREYGYSGYELNDDYTGCDSEYSGLLEESCVVCNSYSGGLIKLKTSSKWICKLCANELVGDLRNTHFLEDLEDEFFRDFDELAYDKLDKT